MNYGPFFFLLFFWGGHLKLSLYSWLTLTLYLFYYEVSSNLLLVTTHLNTANEFVLD